MLAITYSMKKKEIKVAEWGTPEKYFFIVRVCFCVFVFLCVCGFVCLCACVLM